MISPGDLDLIQVTDDPKRGHRDRATRVAATARPGAQPDSDADLPASGAGTATSIAAVAIADGVVAEPPDAGEPPRLGLDPGRFGLRSRPPGDQTGSRRRPRRGRPSSASGRAPRRRSNRPVVERAGDETAVEAADREWRCHVRAAVLDREDAARGVREEQVEIGDRYPAQLTGRQLEDLEQRQKRAVCGAGRAQMLGERRRSDRGLGGHAARNRTAPEPIWLPGPSSCRWIDRQASGASGVRVTTAADTSVEPEDWTRADEPWPMASRSEPGTSLRLLLRSPCPVREGHPARRWAHPLRPARSRDRTIAAEPARA